MKRRSTNILLYTRMNKKKKNEKQYEYKQKKRKKRNRNNASSKFSADVNVNEYFVVLSTEKEKKITNLWSP